MNKWILIYLIVLYLSIPGFLKRAHKPFYYGLIPFLNVYVLMKVLRFNIIHLLIITALIIIPYTSNFVLTFIYIFLPFIICYAYGKSLFLGFLGVLFPYFFYPFIAYIIGMYVLDFDSNNHFDEEPTI